VYWVILLDIDEAGILWTFYAYYNDILFSSCWETLDLNTYVSELHTVVIDQELEMFVYLVYDLLNGAFTC
jgi:hypothetical protein